MIKIGLDGIRPFLDPENAGFRRGLFRAAHAEGAETAPEMIF